MVPLSVSHLCKNYEKFSLKDVSFELRPGTITGFIGRNGAGKTTTLKSLLNLVHPDRGEILFFGRDFATHELEIKQEIGFVSGGIDYYPKKKLRIITDVTRRFYPRWDEAAYRRYLGRFELDEEKTPDALSEGMKVKYSLALALSHNASLLLLDEPTSGLDPVSRDELLDIFLELTEQQVTILFSTHITSDLEKCAEDILYIHNGEIVGRGRLDDFTSQYQFLAMTSEQIEMLPPNRLAGRRRTRDGFTALLQADNLPVGEQIGEPADLETIMVHLEKE